MDSLFFNFHHKLCEFYLNSPAKIFAEIISLEHYDYFYNDNNLTDLCLQTMQKRLPILLSRSWTVSCTAASKCKKGVCFPTFLSDSFMAVESVVTVLGAVPFS